MNTATPHVCTSHSTKQTTSKLLSHSLNEYSNKKWQVRATHLAAATRRVSGARPRNLRSNKKLLESGSDQQRASKYRIVHRSHHPARFLRE